MMAEKANVQRVRKMRPKLVAGNMEPNFRMKVTKSDTMIMAKKVVRNQANQLIPGLRPIAFMVFKFEM